jgi:phospholipid/cholesterol/gamma-HCH transport system permease protein
VDALRAMGIDPIRYLVTPRLLGMVLSMLLLGIYFNVIGILGGFLVAQLQISLTLDAFGQNLLQALQVEDLYISLVKNIVFGICIALICCYQGLQVKLSSTEVPQKTTKAVVSSIFFCFFFNALFTVLFYI